MTKAASHRMFEWLTALLRVTTQLESMGVSYVIVGSVATFIHGIPRLTNDTDLVVDFRPEHIEPFSNALEDEFYLERESIKNAIKNHGSFNLLHYESMFKIDIFVAKNRSYDQDKLARRVLRSLSSEPPHQVWVMTAEDNVLSKLQWFRMGNEVSVQQWRDAIGILKTKSEYMDLKYMNETAKSLGISDLLQRAFEEAERED